jgi:hypothetical protein
LFGSGKSGHIIFRESLGKIAKKNHNRFWCFLQFCVSYFHASRERESIFGGKFQNINKNVGRCGDFCPTLNFTGFWRTSEIVFSFLSLLQFSLHPKKFKIKKKTLGDRP